MLICLRLLKVSIVGGGVQNIFKERRQGKKLGWKITQRPTNEG